MHSAGDDQQLDNCRGEDSSRHKQQYRVQSPDPHVPALLSAMLRLLVADVGGAVPRLGVWKETPVAIFNTQNA